MRLQTSPGVTVHGIGHRGSSKGEPVTTAEHRSIDARARDIQAAHGTRGTVVIAEKIGAVAAGSDQAQVDMWMAVAARFVTLQPGPSTQRDAAQHLRKLLATLL